MRVLLPDVLLGTLSAVCFENQIKLKYTELCAFLLELSLKAAFIPKTGFTDFILCCYDLAKDFHYFCLWLLILVKYLLSVNFWHRSAFVSTPTAYCSYWLQVYLFSSNSLFLSGTFGKILRSVVVSHPKPGQEVTLSWKYSWPNVPCCTSNHCEK